MLDKATVNKWKEQLPLIEQMMEHKEVLWLNPLVESTVIGVQKTGITKADVQDASDRLKRFAPYIERVFPETKASKGIIESPLTAIPVMKEALANEYGIEIPGELLLKQDNALPISGSIKARGGI